MKEGKNASHFFTGGFKKTYKCCLLLVVAWVSLIDTHLQSCQLKSSFYNIFDAEMKVLDT